MKAYGYGYSPIFRRVGGIDPQAQAHYDRVIADGGIIPAGLLGCNAWFVAVKAVYAVTDITTAISAGYDPHYLGTNNPALKGIGTTAGQACSKLYSCSGASGDLVQATAASMPLLLVHTGTNYYYAPNVTGNYCQSSVIYNNDNWDVEFSVNCDYSLAVNRVIGQRSAGEGINIAINNTSITLEYRVGATVYIANAFSGNIPYTEYTIRVTRDSVTGLIAFYKNGNLLTTTGSQIAGPLNNTSNIVQVNGVLGGIQGCLGKINWVKLYSGGSVVQHFNPATYNAATSQTQWTSATGEVWTITTGTATTGYKGQIVSFACLQGDGIDDKLNSGALTSVSAFTRYVAANPFQRAGFGVLVSGGNSLNTAFYKDSSAIRIYNTGTGAGALSFTSPSSHILALFTADYNTTSSKAAINNGTDATGTIGDNAAAAVNLFSDNTSAGNGGLGVVVCCVNVNTPTQKTAMYNALKGLYSNSF